MPKMPNVTEVELRFALDGGDDLLMALHDFASRLEHGYCDTLERPAQLARGLSAIASASARMATLVLAKSEMQEQKKELEALMRERQRLAK